MHPHALQSRHILPSILQLMGHPEEPATQCMAIHEARRAVLGAGGDHSDTIQSMYVLSNAYRDLGKSSRAGELLVEVFQTSERLFGRTHRDMIESMKSLAFIYQLQRKHQESAAPQLEATKPARDMFGDDHREPLRIMLCKPREADGSRRATDRNLTDWKRSFEHPRANERPIRCTSLLLVRTKHRSILVSERHTHLSLPEITQEHAIPEAGHEQRCRVSRHALVPNTVLSKQKFP